MQPRLNWIAGNRIACLKTFPPIILHSKRRRRRVYLLPSMNNASRGSVHAPQKKRLRSLAAIRPGAYALTEMAFGHFHRLLEPHAPIT